MQIELLSIVNGTNEGNYNNIICHLILLRYNQSTVDPIELVGQEVLAMKEILNWVFYHRKAKNQIIEMNLVAATQTN